MSSPDSSRSHCHHLGFLFLSQDLCTCLSLGCSLPSQFGSHPSGCLSIVVQSLSHIWLFVTLWTAAHQASLPFTVSWSLLRLMSVESVMPSKHLTFCHLLLFLPSVFSIRVFPNESALCIRWLKYWSFSNSPFSEYSGLIFFRIYWFDLLAVQRTLKSLQQPHNLKISILQCSTFFMVQLLHPYVTTGKNIVLTTGTFFSKYDVSDF